MGRKILIRTYAALASAMTLLGFAALFTRPLGFKIPIVSKTAIAYLDRWAVTAHTLHGPAKVVRGEHWFFFIVLGIVIAAGILTAVLAGRMKK